MNAACSVAKTIDDVKALCATKAELILVGSITFKPRLGNGEPRWFVGDGYALNSYGMPNNGIEFYQKELPVMVKHVHSIGKKLVLNIAGFNTLEYMELAALAHKCKVDLLELNLGCPNAKVGSKQETIVSFNPPLMKEIIKAVRSVTSLPLMVKVSPYSNPLDLKNAAMIFAETGVDAVVASNTFPNGFMPNEIGRSVVAEEFAAVNGKVLFPINLGQVRQFRILLPKNIAVVGVGGIETSQDAKKYFQAGADIVQVATLIVRDGYEALDTVIN